MLSTRIRTRWGAFLCIVGLGAGASSAVAGEDDAFETKFEVFHDRNDVTTLAPIFELRKTIARHVALLLEGQVDAVTGASRQWGRSGSGQGDIDGSSGASARLDGVSGASANEEGEEEPEFRGGLRTGLTYSNAGRVLGFSLYGSKENDYRSFSPAINGAWDFAERNTTLSWAASWFFDVNEPQGSWADLGGGSKRVQSYTVGLTQTFTPLTLGGLTANWIRTTGYIGHPYNPVASIDSGLVGESLPERKDALAVSGQLIQGWLLGDKLGSANTEYRWYTDSWDLRSHTLTLRLSQHLTESTVLRLQGRYYTQTGALFAQTDRYLGPEKYRTADIRFHRFSSWLGGVKVSSEFPDEWPGFAPRRWNLSYDHLVRDTPGNPLLYQLYPTDAWYQQGTARVGLGWDL
ncbi:MAG: DUF3570 domain-containing protein [Fibrobacteria bacterium]|nr:DUF3570 domain-containing protein [Fibrobacteria bacterium]